MNVIRSVRLEAAWSQLALAHPVLGGSEDGAQLSRQANPNKRADIPGCDHVGYHSQRRALAATLCNPHTQSDLASMLYLRIFRLGPNGSAAFVNMPALAI